MYLFRVLTIFSLIGILICKNEFVGQKEDTRVKRDGGLTAAIVGASISAGASLAGTTVGALQNPTFSVSVSGSIENYSKWALISKGCDIEAGYMNIPVRSISSGQREGFAGHKTGNGATGNWVKCTFSVTGNRLVHFMYSAPYSFDIHSNYLTVAVCSSRNSDCRSLNANHMYYEGRPYMTRGEYHNRIHTIKACALGLCVTGVMGNNHHPTIDIKVMPTSYNNLSGVSKSASVKDQWGKGAYEHFVSNI